MSAPYYADDSVTLHHGDCLDVLAEMPDDSVDAIVTDPPYGLEFMGKEWDSFRTYAGGNPDMKPQGSEIRATEDGEWQPGRAYGGRQKNPRCRRCGKLGRGNGSCKCPDPQWDTRTAESANQFQFWCEQWAAECLRVLKPGGHLLAFGGTRTWHRLAVAVEDAGFEVRDSIAWLYGSGFPKSLDVSKAIDKAAGATREIVGSKVGRGARPRNDMRGGRYGSAPTELIDTSAVTAPATAEAERFAGWGTALKPAFEPIVVARKPLVGTVAANVLEWGTGALNIDGTRVGDSGGGTHCSNRDDAGKCKGHDNAGRSTSGETFHGPDTAGGRWPANVLLDGDAAAELDGQTGTLTSGKMQPTHTTAGVNGRGTYGADAAGGFTTMETYGDSGGASRFFPTFRYEAKAPTAERPRHGEVAHPTVKPLDLMRWLVRLVTPPGGTVLEPFAGSGTTAEACVVEGFRCIAIEREAAYLPLIVARLSKPIQPDLFGGAA